MKRSVSLILAAVMLFAVAMPSIAGAEPVKSGRYSYDWSGTGVERVTVKDKLGYTLFIKGNTVNNYVAPLSECPAMDYVKTIDGVTFSNYIRHTTANTKDEAGNIISIYKVYIGLDGAMRSDKDSVEFMTTPTHPFNALNGYIKSRNGYYVNACSDLNMFKTNTPRLMGSADFDLDYLTDIGITPYADGGSVGRAMDGTWKKGLTWVFGIDDNKYRSDGSYAAVYPIRVNQGDDVTYFQVAVTDATNYSGDRNYKEPSSPVTPAIPAENVTAVPNKSAVYINNVLTEFEAYTINENNYFKLRDVALVLRGTEKQFNVTWNGAAGAIDMESNKGYIPVGGEMSLGNGLAKQGILNKSKLLKDGREVDVTGYTINQNNFFKLRDLGELFDFNVSWDGNRNSIVINTAESYNPNN